MFSVCLVLYTLTEVRAEARTESEREREREEEGDATKSTRHSSGEYRKARPHEPIVYKAPRTERERKRERRHTLLPIHTHLCMK